MLIRRTPNGSRTRRGSTIVESALVLVIFLALLFGLFEYCRFLLVLHVANNAARDGARYAVVNVSKPSNFDTTPFTDAAGITYPSIQAYTTSRMGGVDQQITGYQVAVYPCDQAGLAMSPPVVRPKTTSTATPAVYPDPFNQSDPNRVPWNAAAFTERIAVHIRGTYNPITPLSVTSGRTTIALVPNNIPLNVISIMGSEG
jgi:Flp pilus assembly protein TadG